MQKAFSIIELIVAIVVIGIVITTLPLFFAQSNKSNEIAIQQEAIFTAQSTLRLILTNEWDENSYDNSLFYSAVLDVSNGDTELNRVGTSTRRVGHVKQNKRRKFFSTITNASAIYLDRTSLYNDIDDFDNKIVTMQTPIPTDTMKNQLLNFTITTKVVYVLDNATYSNSILDDFNFNTNPTNAQTNIKMVQVSVQGLDTNITLRAYASNIGESTIAKRAF